MLGSLRRQCFIKTALAVLLCIVLSAPTGHTLSEIEHKFQRWLQDYDKQYTQYLHNNMLSSWNYETDLNNATAQKRSMESKLQMSKFRREKAMEAEKMFPMNSITDPTLKRSLTAVEDIGISKTSDHQKIEQIANLENSMLKVYSTECYKIDGECKKLQPNGLQSIIAHNRNYEKLKDVWKGWRDVSGRKMRKDFTKWVKLSNEAIRENKDYKDLGESWRAVYGGGFIAKVEKLLEDIQPLYRSFHAYVRDKLIKKYGANHFKDNLIPAHLLGNMWAQDWGNIDDIVLPYKERLDVTGEMKRQKYSVKMMFKEAENFFTSIGLKNMTDLFWKNSVFEKLPDKEMVCHASAWDLMQKDDFRIKMCTEINMEDFVTIHHEMGHIQYYQQYEDQPSYFRNGANPGFHEAVGDTLALSVSTPEHLRKLNLSKEYKNSQEGEINFLMLIAMDKLVFVPFAYIMDKFRWNVFSGKISENEYTAKWWEYKCKYQGIRAPVQRTEEDFDPGAKMHIAGAVPYIRYFVSYVIQFQFHKALCDKINHKGPIHTCDIYEKKDAGNALADMLKLGASVSWEDALYNLTGTKEMDAQPMLEYFKPLQDWLDKNTDNKTIGWNCDNVIKSYASSSSPSSWNQRISLKSVLLACIFYAFFSFY